MNYLFGMALPLFAFLFVILFLCGRKIPPVVYDERQTAIRGTAYKYSTVSGVLGGFILAFLVEQELLPIDGGFALMSVSLFMVCVYIIFMIMKGAYFGVSGHWKKWTVLIFLIGLSNTVTGALRIHEDGLPDGKLGILNINLLMGILFMLIVAAVLLQKLSEKRSMD